MDLKNRHTRRWTDLFGSFLKPYIVFFLFGIFFGCGSGKGGKDNNNETNTNLTPEIVSAPEIFAKVNTAYIYKAFATDIDGDSLTYSLAAAPDGMEINSMTGTISWIPSSSQGGSKIVTLEVSDGKAKSTQTYNVSVETEEIIASNFISANAGGILEITDPGKSFFGSKIEVSQGVLSQDSTVKILQIKNPNYLPDDISVLGISAVSENSDPSNKTQIANSVGLENHFAPAIPIRITITYSGTIPSDYDLYYSPCDPATSPHRHFVNVEGSLWCKAKIDDPKGVTKVERLNNAFVLEGSFANFIKKVRFTIANSSQISALQVRNFKIYKEETNSNFQTDSSGRNLLIIHGVCSSSLFFQEETDLIPFFVNSPYYKNIIFYDYPWTEPIVYNAHELSKFIISLNIEGTFDIIAHSMGGMVARYAIENTNPVRSLRGKVKNLFMLATPNDGVHPSFKDNAFCPETGPSWKYPGIEDSGPDNLIKGSGFLSSLNRYGITERRLDTAYYLFTADTENKDHEEDITGSRFDHVHTPIVQIPANPIKRVDFVPVAKDQLSHLPDLNLEEGKNALTFITNVTRTSRTYDHSTIHTECSINAVCEEIDRRLPTSITVFASVLETGDFPISPISKVVLSASFSGNIDVEVGNSIEFKAIGKYIAGIEHDITSLIPTINWINDDSSIIEKRSHPGIIFEAKKAGVTKVTTKFNGQSAHINITVTDSVSPHTPSDQSSPSIAITTPTTASTYNTTSSTVTLSGTASDNVGVTQVSWVNSRGGSGTASGTTNWSVSNITLQTGDNVITITARDAAGNTASDTLTVTLSVPTPTPLPAAPTELSVTVLSSDRIILAWKDNSGNETGFKVERRIGTSAFSEITIVGASNDTGVSFENTGLSASTTYCYRIKASNAAGDSLPSNEACATTNALPPILPTAITNSATNITSNSATLNATINGNGVSTGAFFDWGTNTAPPYGNSTPARPGITSGASNISFSENITNLSPNTTYRFRVVAANTAGGTTFGDTQTFTMPPAIGTRSLRLTVNGTGAISLSPASREGTTSCSSTCTLTYHDNTTVTLTASPAGLPASGTIFSRWDGCPNISGATCTVTVTADASVTANFSCFEVEVNNGSPSASPLVSGKACFGVISTSTDVDWFRVGTISSGTRIRFILAVPSGLDYELEVYGPSSSNSAPHFLCASRNGAGVGEKVVFTTTAPGTFYLRIFGANSSHFNSTSLYAAEADFPVSDTTLCGL
ncbi:fibronectin type III domain-containing protein [Candidatus Manganitrophus noduliformans]|uniref:Fibronectin type-III domain-containing protein n=1 Tax=Candidatus Manganitrophus noduliformans TaxID=2606439 RepID=A0A7X6ID06_9BACT|nr:fibronectin type III domain-containing protein [Candidatus Manganitrophus noduliformans]NKE72969.1 hypothetical protein [Candidatus Manganitrophus noduliformans]